jgi:hypothetical protein
MFGGQKSANIDGGVIFFRVQAATGNSKNNYHNNERLPGKHRENAFVEIKGIPGLLQFEKRMEC